MQTQVERLYQIPLNWLMKILYLCHIQNKENLYSGRNVLPAYQAKRGRKIPECLHTICLDIKNSVPGIKGSITN